MRDETQTAGRPPIRTARPDEWARLRAIETESEILFTEIGIGPFADDLDGDHLGRAAVVLVAGDPPVGFASVEIVDGLAHVWQLSVLPSAGRRGIGTALMEAVAGWARDQGLDAVTLTTFRDVAWNAPSTPSSASSRSKISLPGWRSYANTNTTSGTTISACGSPCGRNSAPLDADRHPGAP
jgi:GNAT superfamily N-acetyltransferase